MFLNSLNEKKKQFFVEIFFRKLSYFFTPEHDLKLHQRLINY
jgi:hypothetical protein